jgi:host factor-I protein
MRVQEQRHSMKDTLDSSPARLATDKLLDDEDNFANRKLIRPALPRADHNGVHANGNHNPLHLQVPERRERTERSVDRGHDHRGNDRGGNDRAGHDRAERSGGAGRKMTPPEQTNAENFYYQKQMQSKTPMVIVLRDGERIHGVIEWYDKSCIKVVRNGGANLLIYKPAIKYLFKEGENSGK